MTRREIAEQNFLAGYNCAQAVALAFEDVLGLDRGTLLKLSSSFGGGMGRLREVCGAVSGMFIVAGLLRGYSAPDDPDGKREHYALIQRLAEKFKQQNGSIICRELLGAKLAATTPTPDARTPEYYRSRPCAKLVGDCAEIVAAELGIGDIHYMHLSDWPFEAIAEGRKTVELRLFDEKRREISVGDSIVFENNGRRVKVKVVSLTTAKSFEELLNDPQTLSAAGFERLSASDAARQMRQFYSAEQEKLYGVIAIGIEKL